MEDSMRVNDEEEKIKDTFIIGKVTYFNFTVVSFSRAHQ